MPAVAGRFYPADAHQLRAEVDRLLSRAREGRVGPVPKAVIAPHAGYVYSGPVAASAYSLLAGNQNQIRRVVLVGPSHFVWFRGAALPEADALATPLGEVPVDVAGEALAAGVPCVVGHRAAHASEHSLEVQLPFLQVALGAVAVVALVTGDVSPREVADVLDELWGGDETLIVVSSDLSHYHDYETARRRDHQAAEAIVEQRPDELAPDSACGITGIQALLIATQRRGLSVRLLDLRNSGDTAGPRREVVGYGAFSIG